jgi:hypothetical protein
MNDLSVQDIDSRLTMLFEPDELAAHEYRRTFLRRTPLEPEKRLMLAVLEDAIFCFQRYLRAKGSKEKKLHQDAVTWIFDQSDNWTFSFENICATCGLDPDYLRMGLLNWGEQMNSLKTSHGKAIRAARNTMRQLGDARSQTVKLRVVGGISGSRVKELS